VTQPLRLKGVLAEGLSFVIEIKEVHYEVFANGWP
jgi:hypothetical protein